MYLFLWCVWFRLKVQRHKETKMKKQTNSHTSEQGQVYSRQRVLIWKAFRSCSQSAEKKNNVFIIYLSYMSGWLIYFLLIIYWWNTSWWIGAWGGVGVRDTIIILLLRQRAANWWHFFCRWLPANILKVIGYITVNSPFLGLEKWMRLLIGSH